MIENFTTLAEHYEKVKSELGIKTDSDKRS
jgi:hypothetical protein